MQLSTLRRAALRRFAPFQRVVDHSDSTSTAQSKPQKTEKPAGDGKKNTRPSPEELKKQEEQKKQAEEEKNAIVDPGVEIETKAVTVDAVVYNKKTGQIVTGLKKENFAIFENGVKQNISSFSEPESPITVTLVVEYSKWTEALRIRRDGGVWEPGTVRGRAARRLILHEVHQAAKRLCFGHRVRHQADADHGFHKRSETDQRDDQSSAAELAGVSREAMFDALKARPRRRPGRFGRARKFKAGEDGLRRHAGPQSPAKGDHPRRVRDRHDVTRSNYDEIRKIIQEAGVPIYIISTGNLFYKKYEQYLPDSRRYRRRARADDIPAGAEHDEHDRKGVRRQCISR